jgi:hypothetical protein
MLEAPAFFLTCEEVQVKIVHRLLRSSLLSYRSKYPRCILFLLGNFSSIFDLTQYLNSLPHLGPNKYKNKFATLFRSELLNETIRITRLIPTDIGT